jgi:hypothetical protein
MGETHIKEFNSLAEFERYINETPLNSVFRWAELGSTQKLFAGFNKTNTFDEALDLLKHGWDDMAKIIEHKFQLTTKEVHPKTVMRSRFDVVGFQASVPRYLQGIPQNMINQTKVVQKQKVVTIVKHIGYRGDVKEYEIIENSIKALAIVKKIEAQGYRVNLDVISPASTPFGNNETIVCRIRIKSAGEKLNISKAAFPMVHPDMLRRMIFRFREVLPGVTDKAWKGSYGATLYNVADVKKFLHEGEYYLHNFIGDIDEEMKKMKIF